MDGILRKKSGRTGKRSGIIIELQKIERHVYLILILIKNNFVAVYLVDKDEFTYRVNFLLILFLKIIII